jgi:Tol biopolymer transport system component
MRFRILVAAAATLAVGVCSAGAAIESGSAPLTPGQASRPLLGSDHNGTVFSVQPGGGDFVRLFPCGLGSPSLAPDGQTYLAQGIEPRARLTYGRIFRLPLSDSVPTRCDTAHNDRLPSADTGLRGWFPRFSPNGRRILFINPASQQVTKIVTAGLGRVATAAANGSGKRIFGPRDVTAAGWSPDGSKIAVARLSYHSPCKRPPGQPPSSNPFCHTGELLVMNSDGSNVRSLYVVPRFKPLRKLVRIISVDWSPKGAIVFTIEAGGPRGATQLAVIGADGKGYRALTPWPRNALHGVWSPSGTSIAFTERRGAGVFLTTPTGRPVSNVTKTWATNGLDW